MRPDNSCYPGQEHRLLWGRMPRIPKRYGPLIYGVIQSGITTLVASGIATFGALGLSPDAVPGWALSWLVAWLTMLPLVVVIAPVIQRIVLALTEGNARL